MERNMIDIFWFVYASNPGLLITAGMLCLISVGTITEQIVRIVRNWSVETLSVHLFFASTLAGNSLVVFSLINEEFTPVTLLLALYNVVLLGPLVLLSLISLVVLITTAEIKRNKHHFIFWDAGHSFDINWETNYRDVSIKFHVLIILCIVAVNFLLPWSDGVWRALWMGVFAAWLVIVVTQVAWMKKYWLPVKTTCAFAALPVLALFAYSAHLIVLYGLYHQVRRLKVVWDDDSGGEEVVKLYAWSKLLIAFAATVFWTIVLLIDGFMPGFVVSVTGATTQALAIYAYALIHVRARKQQQQAEDDRQMSLPLE